MNEHTPPQHDHESEAGTPHAGAATGTLSGPSAPPQPPPPRRLMRDTEHEVIGGVAAGLANYLAIDPVIVRILFVALALGGGFGILLYIICWIAMPEAPKGDAALATDRPRAAGEGTPTWLPIALIVAGGLWFATAVGFARPGMVWAAALVGVGVLLLYQDTREQRAAPTAGAAPPPGSPASTPAPQPGSPASTPAPQPGSPASTPAPPPGSPAWTPSPPPPPAPPRPGSKLGRVTAGALLVVLGVAALLDSVRVLDVGFAQYVALALLVVGFGLVAGAWWGRSRGMIVVGLLLIPVLALASVGQNAIAVEGGVGERSWTPRSIEELQSGYSLFAGEAVLDLRELPTSGEAVPVRARVTFGELRVHLPPGAVVEVRAQAAAGEARLLDRAESGLGVDLAYRSPGGAPPDFVLDLAVAFGEITVRGDQEALR